LNFQIGNLSAQSSLDFKIDEIRTSYISLIEEQDIVEIAIIVSLEDSVIWSEDFGYSDLQGKNAIELV